MERETLAGGLLARLFLKVAMKCVFLDIASDIIEAFNEEKQCTEKAVNNDGYRNDTVKNVRAVDANTPQAIEEIAQCDLMATSVGVNVMLYIAQNIAEGVKVRRAINR